MKEELTAIYVIRLKQDNILLQNAWCMNNLETNSYQRCNKNMNIEQYYSDGFRNICSYSSGF